MAITTRSSGPAPASAPTPASAPASAPAPARTPAEVPAPAQAQAEADLVSSGHHRTTGDVASGDSAKRFLPQSLPRSPENSNSSASPPRSSYPSQDLRGLPVSSRNADDDQPYGTASDWVVLGAPGSWEHEQVEAPVSREQFLTDGPVLSGQARVGAEEVRGQAQENSSSVLKQQGSTDGTGKRRKYPLAREAMRGRAPRRPFTAGAAHKPQRGNAARVGAGGAATNTAQSLGRLGAVPTHVGSAIATGDINASTPNASRTQVQWDEEMHVTLLHEVLRIEPYNSGYGRKAAAWSEIAEVLQCYDSSVTARGCQERFKYLQREHQKFEQESITASGVEQTYPERRQLMTDIIERIEESAIARQKASTAAKRKEEQLETMGERLCNEAEIRVSKRLRTASSTDSDVVDQKREKKVNSKDQGEFDLAMQRHFDLETEKLRESKENRELMMEQLRLERDRFESDCKFRAEQLRVQMEENKRRNDQLDIMLKYFMAKLGD